MLSLNNLKSTSKKRKRIGRGGDKGGTSGKGHKGQIARSGSPGELKAWFEGGQMNITRRLPKRGFNNRFKKDVRIVNLQDIEERFSSGDTVNTQSLIEKNLVKTGGKFYVKILGTGKLTKKLTVCADKLSKSAVEQIEKAGGKVELVREA